MTQTRYVDEVCYCQECHEEIGPLTVRWPTHDVTVVETELSEVSMVLVIRPIRCAPCTELRKLGDGMYEEGVDEDP